MGIHLIKMPDIGEGIAEVELVEWHVQPGDTVVEDQVLADVMTDKATVEVPSPVHGTVQWLGGKVGEVMAVGADLIRITVDGPGNVRDGDAAPAAPAAPAARDADSAGSDAASRPGASDVAASVKPDVAGVASCPVAAAVSATTAGKVGQNAASVAMPAANTVSQAAAVSGRPEAGGSGASAYHGREPGERPTASPAVRRQAWDMGIDLRFVRGSGPQGRILREDLQAYAAHGGQQEAAGAAAASAAMAYGATAASGSAALGADAEGRIDIPVVGLRRRIAQKMQESKRHIPHFSYVEEVDITELEALRGQLNAQWGASHGKLTLLPLLARAIILALRDFPHINARYDDEAQVVTQYRAVHLGVAAQTDAGLMVPVLRHAESLDLWQCADGIARLAQAARSGKAARDELSGSTITLTSLGALGGIVSTPVINHPEVAIVGVNRMVEKPVVRDGAIVVRKTMNLSSSFDHRVVDGMHAAQFIQAIRRLLEYPALLFVAPVSAGVAAPSTASANGQETVGRQGRGNA